MYLSRKMLYPRIHFFILIAVFFQNFCFKFKYGYESTVVKSIDEFLIYLVAIVFFLSRGDLLNRFFLIFKIPVLFYFLYILCGFFSSATRGANLEQTVYQFFLDIKIIIVMFISYCFYSDAYSIRYLKKFFLVFIFFNCIYLTVQIFFPSFYDSLFDAGLHTGGYYTSAGDVFIRFSGFVTHPGVLGMIAGFSIAFFVTESWQGKLYSVRDHKLAILLSVLFLIASLSRGEIFSFLVGFFVCWVSKNKVSKTYLFLAVSSLLLIFYFSFEDFFIIAFKELGILYSDEVISPRAIFLFKSIEIAIDNFPFGVGLGYYGGQAAVVFSSDVYLKYGFDQYFWYSLGLFLTDTYWPKVIGETGFLGFIFLVISFYSFIGCLNSMNRSREWYYSFYCIVAMILNSLSSPSFNDSLYLIISFYLIGNLGGGKLNEQKNSNLSSI